MSSRLTPNRDTAPRSLRENGREMPNLRIDSGVAAVALSGEPEIGDGRVIVARPNGLLVAAMDGLGHGPQAALASRRAAAVLQRHPEAPLMELMQLCHTEL